jgi:hypothetical protein
MEFSKMSSRTRNKQITIVRKKVKEKEDIVLKYGPNPTPFKTFKLPLKRVLREGYFDKLEELVFRLNDLVFHTYQFIRGYILYCLGDDLLGNFVFEKEFIRYSIRVLGESGNQRNGNLKSDALYNKLEDYYTIYQQATGHQKTDLRLMSHFTANIAVEIQTAIETNIKERFVQHFQRLINKTALGRECTRDEKPRLSKLKKSLLERRLDEVEDEFCWFVDFIKIFTPQDTEQHVYYDVKKRPWLYLRAMILMNRVLENEGHRSFNDVPLRTDSIPKNIMIDSTSLADYLIEHEWKKKTKVMDAINEHKTWMWKKFLNMNHRIFKSKNYTFYHQIHTDGISCSLLFIRKDLQNEEGVKESYSITDLKFPALVDETDPEQYAERLVGCDPGKRSLVYLSDGKRKLQFTAPQRKFESWSGKMQYRIKTLREGITLQKEDAEFTPAQVEGALSEYRHNTTYHGKFLEYCAAKTQARTMTSEFYRHEVFRKMRMRTWIRGRSSVDRFVNRIGETFGQDCVIAYGDWSRTTQMKGCMPSLGIGLRRLIHRKYRTFSVNEAYTSKRCSCCGSDMENARGELRDGSFGSIHRLKCCSGCVSSDNKNVALRNRDLNAAKNILQVGWYYCYFQRRHPWFECVPNHAVRETKGNKFLK